jgi:hypothetical protein
VYHLHIKLLPGFDGRGETENFENFLGIKSWGQTMHDDNTPTTSAMTMMTMASAQPKTLAAQRHAGPYERPR